MKHKQHQSPAFELPEGHEIRFKEKLNLCFLEKEKKFSWIKIAAILIPLFFISGYALLNLTTSEDILADYSPELSEAESYMNYQIKLRKEKLKDLKNEENQLIIENSLQEINNLKNDYQLLLEDYKKSNGNEQLKIFILSNLDIQIEILENYIQKIDYLNHYKSEYHENIL